jgi:hydrogenase expression/formation protein HypC
MCLAVPAMVTSVEGHLATVDLGRITITIDASLLPDLRAGEHVLVHAGFAIQRLDAGRASMIHAVLDRGARGITPAREDE